eukprot:m.55527 g.55527  ORF g.55527 m.55527 type:complete len:70 (+) comp12536_c0_seq1:721-930(+)
MTVFDSAPLDTSLALLWHLVSLSGSSLSLRTCHHNDTSYAAVLWCGAVRAAAMLPVRAATKCRQNDTDS